MKKLDIRMKANDVAEVMLYGVIGGGGLFDPDGVTAAEFRKELKSIKAGTINLRINSPGGSTIEAAAMLAALDEHKARIEVDIDGLAASAASVVAMAGDVVRINGAALLMIHNPWAMLAGDAAELRKTADVLDMVRETILDAYKRKATASREEIAAWMDAETWFTGQEAVAAGFASEVTGGRAVAACAGLEKFGYRKAPAAATAAWAEHHKRAAIAAML